MQERHLLLAIADDELVLGWRDSEWTGIAPVLEEDVALSSIAQNEVGHARAIYQLLSDDADALAFDRKPDEYRCSRLVEMRFVPDWAATIARRVLYEQADELRLRELMTSQDPAIAGLAAKIDREEAYHRMHAEMWHARLEDEPRYRAALDPGGGVVTEDEVWSALAELEDPEIPVISLVDLGVVRDVQVEGERVHVEFTPTFLGCPALEVMRDAMSARIAELGAEPEVEVVLDDSWSTERITPVGREKLRAAGFAPPTPRGEATTLVQLQSNGFRCPYCGSRETALENIFGPTPCRSLRYCRNCKQPFEQFKTI